MHPILFHLGPLTVHSYGVFIALALVGAGYVLRSELERHCGRGEAAFVLTAAAAVGGFAGARVYFLFEHLGRVGVADSLTGAGFTWYGGVIGGTAAMLAVARRRGVPTLDLLAAAAPALALGYGLGRIACQFAGDGTYGVASHLPWAMSYPHGEVPTTERVHPTPVYETLASLVIFAVLWRRRVRMPPLRLFALYLVLSGAERFLVEFIRRNEKVLLGLTQPQLFALALMAGGCLLLWRGFTSPVRAQEAPSTPAG